MPHYDFKDPETGEIKTFFQHMNEDHTYLENGVEWSRVYTSPQARVGSFSEVDANDFRSFDSWLNKGSHGTVGDLWDASKELSEKREKQFGKDPLKEQALENYSKERGGTAHPTVKKGV